MAKKTSRQRYRQRTKGQGHGLRRSIAVGHPPKYYTGLSAFDRETVDLYLSSHPSATIYRKDIDRAKRWTDVEILEYPWREPGAVRAMRSRIDQRSVLQRAAARGLRNAGAYADSLGNPRAQLDIGFGTMIPSGTSPDHWDHHYAPKIADSALIAWLSPIPDEYLVLRYEGGLVDLWIVPDSFANVGGRPLSNRKRNRTATGTAPAPRRRPSNRKRPRTPLPHAQPLSIDLEPLYGLRDELDFIDSLEALGRIDADVAHLMRMRATRKD